jgi:hypothetical protein
MKRTVLITLALIAALAVAAYLVLQRPGESSYVAGSEQMLVTYDSAAVDRLVISGTSGTVVLEQQAGTWMLREPIASRASGEAVTAAVGKGRSIALRSVVSSNPAKQSLFQVDSSGTLVRVFEHGVEKAAFRVGKPSSTYQETYVRVEGSNDVYLTHDRLTQVFSRPVKDWRDRAIFRSNPAAITSIGYRYGDTTFVLAFRDSLWTVDNLPAAQPAVQQLVTALASLQCDEFIDTAVAAPPKPNAVIAIGDVEIRLFEIKGASKYLVQSSASSQWFELQQWRAQQVLKRKPDLLPPA